jgi:hypothetical protein
MCSLLLDLNSNISLISLAGRLITLNSRLRLSVVPSSGHLYTSLSYNYSTGVPALPFVPSSGEKTVLSFLIDRLPYRIVSWPGAFIILLPAYNQPLANRRSHKICSVPFYFNLPSRPTTKALACASPPIRTTLSSVLRCTRQFLSFRST